MQIKAIGYIESCYPDKFGTPRQPGLVTESKAKLKLRADLQPEECLQGLEGFSHIWLIFWFHLNKISQYHPKVHPPRLGGESRGLFATRTPHRPNPIGLSLVKLDRIENSELYLSGIDLVNGTPILDIKPYINDIESVPDAKSGWVKKAEKKNIEVRFTPEALEKLKHWQTDRKDVDLKKLIEQTIWLDPRPLVYRGFEGQSSPYRENHAVRLFDGDIHFRFLTADIAEVLEIKL